MLIGIEPPEWATKLVDHWVVFNDPSMNIIDVKAFVFYADYLEHNKQVRVFATPLKTAVKEAATGELDTDGNSLYEGHIEDGDCTIIETPAGLEDWTANQIAENQKSDQIGADLCAKQQ